MRSSRPRGGRSPKAVTSAWRRGVSRKHLLILLWPPRGGCPERVCGSAGPAGFLGAWGAWWGKRRYLKNSNNTIRENVFYILKVSNKIFSRSQLNNLIWFCESSHFYIRFYPWNGNWWTPPSMSQGIPLPDLLAVTRRFALLALLVLNTLFNTFISLAHQKKRFYILNSLHQQETLQG